MSCSLGGATGLLLGYCARNLIPTLFEDSWRTSSLIDAKMDWRVFAFALGVTVLTGLLFGVAPAWRSARVDVNSVLKASSRLSAGRPRAILAKSLVVFQIALSLLLLVGAGLFLRTLTNLRTTSIGFNPEHVLLFDLDPPRSHYSPPQRIALFHRINEALAALPGIQRVSLSSEPLLANSMDNGCFRPQDRAPGSPRQDSAMTNYVGAGFFETLGIPVVSGRTLSLRDNQSAPKVAVINRRLARDFFPNTNPVGRTIIACEDSKATPIQIVGLTADAKYSDIRDDPPPTIYLPYLQSEDVVSMTFELKTAASTQSLIPQIRNAVSSVDKDLPLLEVRTQTQQIAAILSNEGVFATLTTGFGLLALILASIGIYGIMAYTVSRRTNEIGIRMALGARTHQVLRTVLSEASLLACLGIVAGGGSAIGLARVVRSMLYGIKPNDPLSLIGAALVMFVIALLAGFAPARRAATVDPQNALRHE